MLETAPSPSNSKIYTETPGISVFPVWTRPVYTTATAQLEGY